MLGHLYYTFGLLIIISLLSILVKFDKITVIREWYIKYKKVTGKVPLKKEFRNKEESDLYNTFSSVLLLEFIWTMGGLLTGSWYIFIFMFIYTLIMNLIKKPIEFTFLGKVIFFKLFLLKLIIYLYLIINHFHLHLDTWSYIKTII
jgi:hypothetical protein